MFIMLTIRCYLFLEGCPVLLSDRICSELTGLFNQKPELLTLHGDKVEIVADGHEGVAKFDQSRYAVVIHGCLYAGARWDERGSSYPKV